METTTDIYYLPVANYNENGDLIGYSHIQYQNTENRYAFRSTEHDIDIIDRDGASLEDIRHALEQHYTENGVSGEIVSLKDENGVTF